jgi:hemerythrin
MQLFQWGKQYDVFSPQLDAEHREVFRLGGDLHKAVTSKAPKARVNELLRALIGKAEDHFSHEERLMREMRYQAYDWHKGQHDGVRRRVKAFVRRIEAGDGGAAEELLQYLASWMRDHTAVTDRMMSARLRAYEREHSSAR